MPLRLLQASCYFTERIFIHYCTFGENMFPQVNWLAERTERRAFVLEARDTPPLHLS